MHKWKGWNDAHQMFSLVITVGVRLEEFIEGIISFAFINLVLCGFPLYNRHKLILKFKKEKELTITWFSYEMM